MTREEKVLQLKQDFDEVYEAGKQAEYDAFWDSFQDYGNRTNYTNAFPFWSDAIFKPKYDIRPIEAYQMFTSAKIKDLVGALSLAGVKLDFSRCQNLKMAFYFINEIETIPIVDTTATIDDSASGTFYYLFANSFKIMSIEKIILKQSGSQMFNNTFRWLTELQELRFEGIIGQNGLDLQWSAKLSKASIISVINALSTTTSGLSIILPKTAVDREFEEGDRPGSDSQEWEEILRYHFNWTISLV